MVYRLTNFQPSRQVLVTQAVLLENNKQDDEQDEHLHYFVFFEWSFFSYTPRLSPAMLCAVSVFTEPLYGQDRTTQKIMRRDEKQQ